MLFLNHEKEKIKNSGYGPSLCIHISTDPWVFRGCDVLLTSS